MLVVGIGFGFVPHKTRDEGFDSPGLDSES
jgi:hypothetical protein